MTQGYDNQEVAELMGLSEYTIRNHVHSILQKLAADNRVQAILRAIAAGLVPLKSLQERFDHSSTP